MRLTLPGYCSAWIPLVPRHRALHYATAPFLTLWHSCWSAILGTSREDGPQNQPPTVEEAAGAGGGDQLVSCDHPHGPFLSCLLPIAEEWIGLLRPPKLVGHRYCSQTGPNRGNPKSYDPLLHAGSRKFQNEPVSPSSLNNVSASSTVLRRHARSRRSGPYHA